MDNDIYVKLAEYLHILKNKPHNIGGIVRVSSQTGRQVLLLIKEYDLVRFSVDNPDALTIGVITDSGLIADAKGVKFYIEDKINTAKKSQEISDKTALLNLKHLERIKSTYWYSFAFSVIAIIISVFLLILKLIE